VTEHRIRFRGGWECCPVATPESDELRLTLPIRWSRQHPSRLQLTRRFGRPPLDPDSQVLFLQLDQVPGIQSLLLNGRPIARVSPEESRYEIRLDDLPNRNVLLLEIETPRPGDQAAAQAEWGRIALVIRPLDPTRNQ
jgi:hypothetical protein